MDGGSKDGTQEILKQYPELIWRSEPDRGQAHALNKALSVAHGQFIGWINSDDTYEPGALHEALAYLEAHPEIDVVYGDMNFIDQDGLVRGKFPGQPFRLQTYLFEDYIPQQSAFFRHSAVEEVGGWSESLGYLMDYDLFLRLGKEKKLAYLPRTWGNFRLYTGTKTMAGGAIPSRKEKIQVLEKFLCRTDLPAEINPIVKNAIHYTQGLLNIAQAWQYYQERCGDQATQQLDMGLRLAPELLDDQAKFLTADLLTWIGRYANQEPARFAAYVLEHLPGSLQPFKAGIRKKVMPPALAAELFNAHERGDSKAGRTAFFQLVMENPRWLSNRGVLSVGGEVFLGKRAAGTVRKLARRLN